MLKGYSYSPRLGGPHDGVLSQRGGVHLPQQLLHGEGTPLHCLGEFENPRVFISLGLYNSRTKVEKVDVKLMRNVFQTRIRC